MFKLTEHFLKQYEGVAPAWGPIGYVTYKRTYSRDGEEWKDTVKRVVEGCYNIQKKHCAHLRLPWNPHKAQKSAQKMYELMFDFKFLPPGRGLWVMGTDIIEKKLGAALNNCFAHPTEIITLDGVKKIGDCVGTTQTLLTEGGEWTDAPINSFGRQQIYDLVISTDGGLHTETIGTTADHIWFTDTGERVYTKDLKTGQVLQSTSGNHKYTVIEVERTKYSEEVYCATVPEYGCFTLANGILTSNCAFISTEHIDVSGAEVFSWTMDMSMLGVGVGFDTKGAGKVNVVEPKVGKPFTVPDTKEGWAEAARLVIDAYFGNCQLPEYFDFSEIRPEGSIIRTFGGVAPGPEPLARCVDELKEVLDKNVGSTITSTTVVDLMNIIGKAVVSGGVRRCLLGTDEVITDSGIKKIADLSPQDLLLTHDGSFQSVLNVQNMGKKQVIEYKTPLGTYESSPEHRWGVVEDMDGNVNWKQSDQIVSGDVFKFNSVLVEGKYQDFPEDVLYNMPKLNSDLSWFIGYFLGNGSCSQRVRPEGFKDNKVRVSFPTDIPELENKISQSFKYIGGNFSQYDKGTSKEFSISKNNLTEYFLKYIKQPNTEITIPRFIKENSSLVRKSFLAGLLDADGSVKNRNTKTFCLVSTKYNSFAKEVQSLYSSLGIPTKLRKKERDGKNTEYLVVTVGSKFTDQLVDLFGHESIKVKNYYTPWVNAKDASGLRFPKKLFKGDGRYSLDNKFMGIHKFEKDYGEIPFIPVCIEEVKYTDRYEEMYDLEVEKNNNFYVNGVLTHNSAEISIGDPDDEEYLKLKDYDLYPEELTKYRWASNNSVFAYPGMNYDKLAKQAATNGEPGFVYLENIQKYGRLKDGITWADANASGVNPCAEMGLWGSPSSLGGAGGELCNLCELFPSNHDSWEEFRETIKYAYLYAKTVTLVPTHCEITNQIMLRNRRIGLSMTGIIDAINKFGRHNFFHTFCDEGYKRVRELDKKYSDWLCIPESIKVTTVKPSGSVSLLAGVSPGIHYPHSEYYIRRMEIQKTSPLVDPLKRAGLKPIQSVYKAESYVFEFPIHTQNFTKGKADVTIWEQVQNAADIQHYWSDNSVSQTVTVKDSEKHDVKSVLEAYEDKLKAISFLPMTDHRYEQAPYEAITEEEYLDRVSKIKMPLEFSESSHEVTEEFCTTDTCEVTYDTKA